MTAKEVLARVDAIRQCAFDDECAHSMEDKLHLDVLEAIALRQCDDPVQCAAWAYSTRAIEFTRWRA